MTRLTLLLPWTAAGGSGSAHATAAAVAERAPWLEAHPVEVEPLAPGTAPLALAGLTAAGAGSTLMWSGPAVLDPCHLHAELLLWRPGPAALGVAAPADLPWAVLQRQLALPAWEGGTAPGLDLALLWAPDASALAALWRDTATLIRPLLAEHDTAKLLTAAFALTLQRLAPQRRLDPGSCQLPRGLAPTLPQPLPPLTLSQAIWESDQPSEALFALAEAALTHEPPSLAAMAQAVEAAAMLRQPPLLTGLWQRLDDLPPSPYIFGLRLRLWLASGRSLPWPDWAGGGDPLALPATLPEADRLLLAQAVQAGHLQHRGLLGAVFETLPPEQRRLHRLRNPNNSPAGPLAGLAPRLNQLSPDQQVALKRCYATAPPSLRRPAFPWYSAEAAEPKQVEGLIDRIAAALASGTGFSVLRLGDGEALFLDGRRPCLGGATTNGTTSPDLVSTNGLLPLDLHEGLQQRFLEAVEAASVIGIPDLGQCLDGPEHYGLVAATLARLLPGRRLETLTARLLPGGSHLHLFLLAAGAFERPPFLKVHGVIGPELPAGLAGSCRWQSIPGEKGKHQLSTGPAHYPQVYDETLAWIAREAGPGRLFLVGAGLLGKIYGQAIQQRGGVAVDVGSVLDLCSGSGVTRGESRLQPYLLPMAARAFRQPG